MEEIGKNGSEILAQKFVSNCYFHQVAFAFCDDTDDDDAHESHVTTPVSVLGNHAARVFPCTCVYFFLESLWKVVILKFVGDLFRIVYEMQDQYVSCSSP